MPQVYKLQQEIRVDPSGRLTLGKSLSGKMFKIIQIGGEIHLIPARVIPENEAWFFEKKKRVKSLDHSVAQSLSGQEQEVSLEELEDL